MEVIVSTEQGAIVGRRSAAGAVFKGIPYAEPPIGRRRWAPPGRPERSSGMFSALRYSAVAPQAPRQTTPIPVMNVSGRRSEDCLSLNVWTPSPDPEARLPVFFWIHGGGYAIGAGSQPLYDGSALAKTGPSVVVTINYRLGPLGFLRLADLTGGAIPSTGNEGLLDQIVALEWVQENVARFGGNPANVTIAGESAGAFSVCCLAVMPRARGLFARAIAQSGAASTAVTRERANDVARAIGDRLALDVADPGAWRRVPAAKLVDAASAIASTPCRPESGIGVMPFQPVIDGEILPALPIELVRRGDASAVPLIVGFNRSEWRLFIEPEMFGLDEDGLRTECRKRIGSGSPAVLEVYVKSHGDPSPIDVLAEIETDRLFGIPAVQLAQAHGRSWLYRLDWTPSVFDGALGSCHTAELGLVFGTHSRRENRRFHGLREAVEPLSRSIMEAWSRFCRDGSPGSIGGVVWPAFGAAGEAMVIDHECRVASGADLPPVEVWERRAIDALGRP